MIQFYPRPSKIWKIWALCSWCYDNHHPKFLIWSEVIAIYFYSKFCKKYYIEMDLKLLLELCCLPNNGPLSHIQNFVLQIKFGTQFFSHLPKYGLAKGRKLKKWMKYHIFETGFSSLNIWKDSSTHQPPVDALYS